VEAVAEVANLGNDADAAGTAVRALPEVAYGLTVRMDPASVNRKLMALPRPRARDRVALMGSFVTSCALLVWLGSWVWY